MFKIIFLTFSSGERERGEGGHGEGAIQGEEEGVTRRRGGKENI